MASTSSVTPSSGASSSPPRSRPLTTSIRSPRRRWSSPAVAGTPAWWGSWPAGLPSATTARSSSSPRTSIRGGRRRGACGACPASTSSPRSRPAAPISSPAAAMRQRRACGSRMAPSRPSGKPSSRKWRPGCRRSCGWPRWRSTAKRRSPACRSTPSARSRSSPRLARGTVVRFSAPRPCGSPRRRA